MLSKVTIVYFNLVYLHIFLFSLSAPLMSAVPSLIGCSSETHLKSSANPVLT
jgi:hypothetical protein